MKRMFEMLQDLKLFLSPNNKKRGYVKECFNLKCSKIWRNVSKWVEMKCWKIQEFDPNQKDFDLIWMDLEMFGFCQFSPI